MVEQGTHKPLVVSSSLTLATRKPIAFHPIHGVIYRKETAMFGLTEQKQVYLADDCQNHF